MRIERVAGRVSAERAADGVVWDAYHEARALGRTRRVRRRSSPARHSRKSWPRRAGAAAAHTRGGSVPRPAHPTQSGDPRERASRRLSCTRLVAGSTDSVWPTYVRGGLSPPPFPPPNFPCPPSPLRRCRVDAPAGGPSSQPATRRQLLCVCCRPPKISALPPQKAAPQSPLAGHTHTEPAQGVQGALGSPPGAQAGRLPGAGAGVWGGRLPPRGRVRCPENVPCPPPAYRSPASLPAAAPLESAPYARAWGGCLGWGEGGGGGRAQRSRAGECCACLFSGTQI